MAPITGTGSRQQYLIDKRAYATNPVGTPPTLPPANAPVVPPTSNMPYVPVGNPNIVGTNAPSTPGTGDWLGNAKPRVTIGPTKIDPVKIFGGPAPVIEPPKTSWDDMTDQQKKDEIFLRGATTDAQRLWERDNEVNAGVQSATTEQAKYDAEKARLAGETEASIQAKSAAQAAEFESTAKRYKESAAEQSNTQQRILDYRGTGESSFAVDTQRKITQAELDQENLLRQKQALELDAYRKELQGADREALKPIYDRINQIKDYNATLEYNKEKDKQALAADIAQNKAKATAPLTSKEILDARLKVPAGSKLTIDGKEYEGLGEKITSAADWEKILNDTPVGVTVSVNGVPQQGRKQPTAAGYSMYTGKDGVYRVNKATGVAELIKDVNGNLLQAPVSLQLHYDPNNPFAGPTVFNPKTGKSDSLISIPTATTAPGEFTAPEQTGKITLQDAYLKASEYGIDPTKVTEWANLAVATQKYPPFAPTKEQGQLAGWAVAMEDSSGTFDENKSNIAKMNTAEFLVQLALPDWAQSDMIQSQRQAERNFVNGIKRRESGAVVSDREIAEYEKQYFPRPGNSEKVLAQKERARTVAINGMKNEAEGAYNQLVNRLKNPNEELTKEQEELLKSENLL